MQAVYIKCFCEVRSGCKMIYNSSTSTFLIHACLFDYPICIWEICFLLPWVCLLFRVLISHATHPVRCCREGSRWWPHFTRGSWMIMISTPGILRFVFRLKKTNDFECFRWWFCATMRKKTTFLFDWGKTDVCIQRCDDAILVQFSSTLEITTEDVDAQTVAVCDLKFVNNSYRRLKYCSYFWSKQAITGFTLSFHFSLVDGWGRVRYNRVWKRGLMSAGPPKSRPVS